jgi:hypothetical protein
MNGHAGACLKLWPHSEMQWASSMHTSGSGNRGASAALRLPLPTRSGDTYSTRILPSYATQTAVQMRIPGEMQLGLGCADRQVFE